MPPKKDGAKAEESEGSSASKAKSAGQKRKAAPPNDANKAPRRSARGRGGASDRAPADTAALLRRLAAPTVPELARPAQEREFVAANPEATTYADVLRLSPFAELVCAVVLSRPIGHALGLRAIRTLLNAPYSFSTPGQLRDAGFERVREALDAARTQHRQKTAQQLVDLAGVVCERFAKDSDDVSLGKLRGEAEKDVEQERELLEKGIKGLGKTGLDIFLRRVQASWEEAYPFVDERTVGSLEKIGLPGRAEDLRKLIEEQWKQVSGETKGEGEGDAAKRKVFVRILERAVAIDLEGNTQEFLDEV